MLGAFLDDSGTHSGSKIVVIGGLLGTEAQWNIFASQWTKLLSNPLPGKPDLRFFGLADCRSGRGEFEGYSHAEKAAITHDFRKIIISTGLVSIAIAVDNLAWQELIVSQTKLNLGSAEEFCFVKCMEQIINTIRMRKPGEELMVCLDQGRRDALGWLRPAFLMQKDKYPELSTLFFAPVKEVVALQGADMIATETYQFNIEWIKDRENPEVNPHFRDFYQRELSCGLFFGREQILEIVERARAAQR